MKCFTQAGLVFVAFALFFSTANAAPIQGHGQVQYSQENTAGNLNGIANVNLNRDTESLARVYSRESHWNPALRENILDSAKECTSSSVNCHYMKSRKLHLLQKMKDGLHKVAEDVKNVATTATNYVKDNGPMIGKFALKVASTYAATAAKAVKFIPGIGAPLSKGLTMASKAANFGSNAIHANLPENLEKAEGMMDKIQNPLGK